jgi:hypothetical protein
MQFDQSPRREFMTCLAVQFLAAGGRAAVAYPESGKFLVFSRERSHLAHVPQRSASGGGPPRHRLISLGPRRTTLRAVHATAARLSATSAPMSTGRATWVGPPLTAVSFFNFWSIFLVVPFALLKPSARVIRHSSPLSRGQIFMLPVASPAEEGMKNPLQKARGRREVTQRPHAISAVVSQTYSLTRQPRDPLRVMGHFGTGRWQKSGWTPSVHG